MPVTRSSTVLSMKATSSTNRRSTSNSQFIRVDQPNPWHASRPRANDQADQAQDQQTAQSDGHSTPISLFNSPASSKDKPKKATSRKVAKRQPGTLSFPITVLPDAKEKTDGRKLDSRALVHIGVENKFSKGFKAFSTKSYVPKDPDIKPRRKNGSGTEVAVTRKARNGGQAAPTLTSADLRPPSSSFVSQELVNSLRYTPSTSSSSTTFSESSSSPSATTSAINTPFSSPAHTFQQELPSVYSNNLQSHATHSSPCIANFSCYGPADLQQYGNGLDCAPLETEGLDFPCGSEGEKTSTHLAGDFDYLPLPMSTESFQSEGWNEEAVLQDRDEGPCIIGLQTPVLPLAENCMYGYQYLNSSLGPFY